MQNSTCPLCLFFWENLCSCLHACLRNFFAWEIGITFVLAAADMAPLRSKVGRFLLQLGEWKKNLLLGDGLIATTHWYSLLLTWNTRRTNNRNTMWQTRPVVFFFLGISLAAIRPSNQTSQFPAAQWDAKLEVRFVVNVIFPRISQFLLAGKPIQPTRPPCPFPIGLRNYLDWQEFAERLSTVRTPCCLRISCRGVDTLEAWVSCLEYVFLFLRCRTVAFSAFSSWYLERSKREVSQLFSGYFVCDRLRHAMSGVWTAEGTVFSPKSLSFRPTAGIVSSLSPRGAVTLKDASDTWCYCACSYFQVRHDLLFWIFWSPLSPFSFSSHIFSHQSRSQR